MNSLPTLLCIVLASIFIAQCRASTIPKGMPLELPKDATPSPLLRDPPTPPLLLPRDATTPAPPPLVFPEDVKNYNIVTNNATILATLRHHEEPEEIDDMLHSSNEEKEEIKNAKISEESTTRKAIIQKIEVAPEKMQQSTTSIPSAPDVDAELIQPIHEEKQKNEHEEQFNNKHNHHDHHHKAQNEEAFLKHMRFNDTTAIMAGSFAAIAVLGFAGLVMWRQMLERKYGTRERLVTEDTYYTNNDLRHFEL